MNTLSLIIAGIFFILLNVYFIVLPLSKKRPVLIKNAGLALYALCIFSIAAFVSNIFVIIASFIFATVLYMSQMWFIFGVSKEEIAATLKKSATLTHSNMREASGDYLINNDSIKIRIICFNKKTEFIIFKELHFSKKTDLFKEIVRKFIQNYLMK
jgi:hypothetical protein